MTPFGRAFLKFAKIVTPLKDYQQRVVDRISKEDQPGLVVAHGTGRGKSLASLAAHDALGLPADIVVPASLQGNYLKEIEKHHKGKPPPYELHSLQNVAVKGLPLKRSMLIVDEAHRLRDPSTKGTQAVRKTEAKKRLLLTATPLYNHPVDIAPLVNIAAGGKILPEEKGEFSQKYIADKVVKPGLIARLRGVKPGSTPVLNPKRAQELREKLQKWVDYEEGSSEGFPSVTKEQIRVPMSSKQLELYDTLMGQAPLWVRYKIKKGLPPSKQEASQLNAFLGAARQASNTTRTYQPGATPEEPKIQRAFEELKKSLDANPRHKGVVYSNFLGAGLAPYKERLTRAGIPFGEFTGELPKAKRDALVRAYNEDKLRALLVSGAGAEGLDLKGTRTLQVLEPSWNEEKIKQVEGRGIRYRSHAHLPPEEQNVRIQRFLSTRPPAGIVQRLGLKKPGMGVDEYMEGISANKEQLNAQFRELLKRQQAHV